MSGKTESCSASLPTNISSAKQDTALAIMRRLQGTRLQDTLALEWAQEAVCIACPLWPRALPPRKPQSVGPAEATLA